MTLSHRLIRLAQDRELSAFVESFYKDYPTCKAIRPLVREGVPTEGRKGHPEATQRGDEVLIFPKFWALPEPTRDFAFAHELGHYLSTQLGSSELLERMEDQGIDGWDTPNLPYAQFNFEEAWADCFAASVLDPLELRTRYPAWEKLVADVRKALHV